MPPIKVGFIGLSTQGWAANITGPALIHPNMRDKFDLVALSTTSPSSSHASAEKYSQQVGHAIKAYHGPESSSQIASDPEVDLVAVSVKVMYHKEVVLRVIEAGKDFFLEWPAGRSTEETREIARAARREGVRSIIGLQGRHSAALVKVKELLASGVIGTVKSTNVLAHQGGNFPSWPPLVSESSRYMSESKNGATRLSIPIAHQLDQLTHVLGSFTSLSATSSTLYPTATFVDADGKPTGETAPSEIPDHFSVHGVLDSGILVNFFWRAGYPAVGPGTGRRAYIWEIDGELGTIRLEGTSALPTINEPEVFLNGEKVVLDVPGSNVRSIVDAWTEFADDWDRGVGERKGSYPTIEDAVRHHELLDAIELSAKEGRRVVLKQ